MATYGKFNTLDEVYAVIIGNIKRNYPNIQRSVFNKIITEMGLESLKKEEFKQVIINIKTNLPLQDLYLRSADGDFTLDDIKVYESISDADLFNIVTPYSVDKVTTQALVRRFNKAQREGSAQVFLSQEIAKNIAQEVGQELRTKTQERVELVKPTMKDVAIITPSDWHIGAEINDVSGNTFNLEIAEARLNDYMNQAADYISLIGADTAVLVHLGDFINHAYMHGMNQAFETELDATEQLAKAIRLYVKMIRFFADKVRVLVVGAIGGNHDRYDGNKKNSIYNDNVAYNVVDTLLLLSESGALPNNVIVKDNRENVYTLEVFVANKHLLFEHGDKESRNDSAKIPAHIRDYAYDYFFMGHYHYNKTIQEDYSRMTYIAGSLMGPNNYSVMINAPRTQASQLLTFIQEDSQTAISVPIFFKE